MLRLITAHNLRQEGPITPMPPQTEPSFIGIELCGSKLRGGKVDRDGVITSRHEVVVDADRLVAQLAEMVSELKGE